jgi:transposase-like protein
MQELLREFEASGETIKAFCEKKGISTWSIYHWRRRLRDTAAKSSEQKPALLPIRVIDNNGSEAASYEIGLRNGRTLKVVPGFNSSEVERLLAIVEQC